MRQQTFTDLEYSNRKRVTKREQFLDSMEEIIPWGHWIDLIRPCYFNNRKGRPPRGIEIMLRMYLLQIWFNLSDEGTEDAIYDSYALRKFSHIDFISEQVPDATTLLKFRHLLEKHNIGEQIFNDITARLDAAGLMMHGGTIVDATIIAAPPSTKNRDRGRDPEMHQTKKGNGWHFGMKVHSGVDAGSGYVHTIVGTAANVHDSNEAVSLLRPDDEVMYGDSGYLGVPERDEVRNDVHLGSIDYRINKRPSSNKCPDWYRGLNWGKVIERQKSSVRSKVEHPFLIVKNFFGYKKTVYRGIGKNLHRFHMLFGSANLLMCIRAGRVSEFCAV